MKSYFVIVCLLTSSGVHSSEVALLKGILSDGGVTSRTLEQKQAAIKVSRVLNEQGLDPYSAISTTGNVGDDIWYRLFDDLVIHVVNIEKNEFLSSNDLKRPASFKLFPEITTQYKDLNVETDTSSYEYTEWLEGVGCMNKSPLRYGDFNGDTNNEVVLFLDNDLVLFSPNAKKIIFSMPIDSSDWLTEAESITVGKDVYGTPKHKYISKYLSQNNTLGAGHRIYGKLFMADFDDNDKLNIITWHKVYESPLLTSDQQGFIKVRDEYQLFEMADSGEYMVKAIEASAIKNLLVDANLTWQKGYPSKSECEGQEGQLIPEMHDPLLNDPDVLK
jgi:hypothetical protein